MSCVLPLLPFRFLVIAPKPQSVTINLYGACARARSSCACTTRRAKRRATRQASAMRARPCRRRTSRSGVWTRPSRSFTSSSASPSARASRRPTAAPAASSATCSTSWYARASASRLLFWALYYHFMLQKSPHNSYANGRMCRAATRRPVTTSTRRTRWPVRAMTHASSAPRACSSASHRRTRCTPTLRLSSRWVRCNVNYYALHFLRVFGFVLIIRIFLFSGV